MIKVRLTQRFVERARDLAQSEQDPAHFQDKIEQAAYAVAASHARKWMDFHSLSGPYAGYWSFKPIASTRDLLVLCVPGDHELVLADIGPHLYFFTRGRKARPPRPATLKTLRRQ